ncbi:MAG: hypothetical protein RR554_10885 [Vagococcus sp.]|uniref:hypothetical protein n=1 Tax=Vagococcus sp. TaxID=1933889 RepID=UPI002FCADA3E
MSECPECYSDNNRMTPMYKAYSCLSEHVQYICGTCHRCICIEKDDRRGLYRWNFPFKSLEDAKVYIRTAEYVLKKECFIYEIKLDKERRSFKIFSDKSELTAYLKKNKDKKCNKVPVFKTGDYQEFPNTEVRKLTSEEVNFYMTSM